MKCEYGCGEEAKYQFKNGKWCCSSHISSCIEMKKINSFKLKGRVSPMKGKTISDEHKKILKEANTGKTISDEHKKRLKEVNTGKTHTEETKKKMSDSKKGIIPWCLGKTLSIEHKKKLSLAKLGKYLTEEHKKNIGSKIKGSKHYLYGKKISKDIVKKRSISISLSIEQIKEKYPTFSKVEEMRYEPGKEEEKVIQVHCKNHNCKNSLDKGGWFTPINKEYISRRIWAIEKEDGNEAAYFYCSDACRNTCPIFNKRVKQLIKEDQIRSGIKDEVLYTESEYQTFRQEVLQRTNNLCEYCGNPAEHVHHIKPQKLEPFFSLDPDFSIACCRECHYKHGHKDECSMAKIANIICKRS